MTGDPDLPAGLREPFRGDSDVEPAGDPGLRLRILRRVLSPDQPPNRKTRREPEREAEAVGGVAELVRDGSDEIAEVRPLDLRPENVEAGSEAGPLARLGDGQLRLHRQERLGEEAVSLLEFLEHGELVDDPEEREKARLGL